MVEQRELDPHNEQEGETEDTESTEDKVYAALEEARARNTELQDLNTKLWS